MAIPPDGGFDLAKSTLQLLNNLAAIVLSSKESQSRDGRMSQLSYSETIKRMGAEVHARAIELRGELRSIDQSLCVLRDDGFDVDKPLAEVRKQGWLYKIHPAAPYKLLRNFGTRIAAIANQSEDLFADVLSFANCKEAEDEIADAIAKARQVTTILKDSVSTTAPMSTVVRGLLAEVDVLVKLTEKL